MDILKREYIKYEVKIPTSSSCYSRPTGPRFTFNPIPEGAGTGAGTADPRADAGSDSGSSMKSGALPRFRYTGGITGGLFIAFMVSMWCVVTTCAVNRDFINLETPHWLCNPSYYAWEPKGESVAFNNNPHPRYSK